MNREGSRDSAHPAFRRGGRISPSAPNPRNGRTVREPKDCRSLKLRTARASPGGGLFETLGAAATQSHANRIYDDLKSGAAQGQESSLRTIEAEKLFEVQKYLSFTHHNYRPDFLVINERFFAGLPPGIQAAISEAAYEVEEWSMERSTVDDSAILKRLAGKMTIVEADKFAFVMASMPLYQNFVHDVPDGKQLIRVLYDNTSMLKADEIENR